MALAEKVPKTRPKRAELKPRFSLPPPKSATPAANIGKGALILWFDQVTIADVDKVGGKNASLGEMYQFLTKKGVRIPNGFCVTADAYRLFLERSKTMMKIQEMLQGLDTRNMDNLAERGHAIRGAIRHAELPLELRDAIIDAYGHLCKQYGDKTDVAVRSSATAEDLPTASFAGQQETFLNIRGAEDLIEACKRCFASLFTNRAISYRTDKGFDHFKIALSIGVQKMVRSDLSCSGVMFTIDTETGFRDAIVINGSYGLGENIVQGAVNPDEFVVFKPLLRKGFRPILTKHLGEKAIKMVYTLEGAHPTKNIDTPSEDRKKFVLSDEETLQLARWGLIIEDHYTAKKGMFSPMDIEWAKDGKENQLYIVQARPETVQSQRDTNKLETYVLKERGKILATGASVGDKIGAGEANIIKDVKDINKFKKGQILVTDMTDPDWEPIMKIASGIVTNRGGRVCHAAIISRELGIPCVVGTNNGTTSILHATPITVSCAEGEEGKVYEGRLRFSVEELDLKQMPKTKTNIMMNCGNPDQAFEFSFLPNSGVGLAREEFIINSYIKIHPKALVEFDKIQDHEVKQKIEEITHGYIEKKNFYVDQLARGVATICAAFYPKDVIVRLADFKSNEYANLIGGKMFEPVEDNPMIGWRGAARFYSDAYKDAFALECQALKKVREEMGLTNLKIMVPMCRTIEEGKKVLTELSKNGLRQHENGLEVYVMCEVPSNVILAEQFCDLFDGFSIGSNDLTQMTLAVDRDSQLVAHIFNERNDAVKWLVKHVIEVAKSRKKKIGICGDAPSTYPEFAEFLVDCGIDSISLSPDAVIKTTLAISRHEQSKTGGGGPLEHEPWD